MNKKFGIAVLAVIVVAAAAVLAVVLRMNLVGCSNDDVPPTVNEDEIKLQIKLDLKEDIGLLLVDYDINGMNSFGGVSNADKSLIERDAVLYWEFEKQQLVNPRTPADITVKFTVVTEYCEPNYDNVFPEEYKIPIDPISLQADFGEMYTITVSGDKTNGYRAVLEG